MGVGSRGGQECMGGVRKNEGLIRCYAAVLILRSRETGGCGESSDAQHILMYKVFKVLPIVVRIFQRGSNIFLRFRTSLPHIHRSGGVQTS